MRASDEMTRVLGCSGSAPTLPLTMPSTRSPPLKITLPSMRVVAPIRLSMRFCGLLDLLNMCFSLSPCSVPLRCAIHTHRVGCARLALPGLVHARLHALHLGFRVHPEGPFDPPEVLECQPELRCRGIAWLREGHHSILAPFLQADHQLQAPVEVAAAAIGGREEQQSIAIFPRQHVGLDLEAVDREGLRMALLRHQHLLE